MRVTTAKAVRNRRSNKSVSLTFAALAAQATGTPSPVTATWYLVPRLPRSVGLGPPLVKVSGFRDDTLVARVAESAVAGMLGVDHLIGTGDGRDERIAG